MMVFSEGLDDNGFKWAGERIQSDPAANLRNGASAFGLPSPAKFNNRILHSSLSPVWQATHLDDNEGESGSDMDTSSSSEDRIFVALSPSDDKISHSLGSEWMASVQSRPYHGCDQNHTDSDLPRVANQLKQGHGVERMEGNCVRNAVRYAGFADELSDSATSTEISFTQMQSNNDGVPQRGSYTSNGYSATVTLQANMEATAKQNCLAGVQLKKISNNDIPSAPPLVGTALEIDDVAEPSSTPRAHETTHSSNWSGPANTDGSEKTGSVCSGTTTQDASGSGISNSPLRTRAGVEIHGSPPACFPVYHASGQGTWCAVISYDASFRLCLHAWAQSYCTEVHCFLENECALLRNAFGLQHVLLQSEAELLAKQSSQLLSAMGPPKPVKASGKIKCLVCKVKMGLDEPPASCSFSSIKPPMIKCGSLSRHCSNLKSTLCSGWNSIWNNYLPPRAPANGSFSCRSLAYIQASAKCVKQIPARLKIGIDSLCNRSSSYEIVQETYSCFLRLKSSPEEDAVQMQPGFRETHVFFPDSVGDDLIIEVQNSKGQHCGRALVQVASIAHEPGDKLRWWPIYSDLEHEPVGRIQLCMEYSTSKDENNHLKCGSVAETVAYDYVLEVAMKVQHFQQRNLLLHGPWRWLVTEFASYYGISDAYVNLRYLSYVMDVATPTEDCLSIVHDLLSDVFKKGESMNVLSFQENRMLLEIEDRVKQTLALVFENYKSLEESSPSGMIDVFRPASGLAPPALAPAIQLYTLLHDILSSEAQLKLCRFFQAAAKKRLRMHFAETDEFILSSNEGTRRDLFTAYQRMKSLILSIRNEIFTDIKIQNQHILLSFIDLPNISTSIYSVDLCSRLRAFLVACPPPGLSPPVAELIIAIADFQRDLSLWNINPVNSGVDAKELFHSHITIWIQEKRHNLLERCKLDKFQAKWSGFRTQHGTTPLIDDMYNQLIEMLNEFDVILHRWPIYTSALENVIADVEKGIVDALDRHYADVLSPLKDNLTNKILGFKYVQKLSKQPVDTYFVPDELGILLNSMKRMLDVLWPNIETRLKSWSSCIPDDGYVTGECLNDVTVMLRAKFRNYRLAIVEKLAENTRVQSATKLKKIIRDSKEVESVVHSKMQPLRNLLQKTIDHLHTVVSPTVFVELCREFWDRMGQDVLHLLEHRRENRSLYKGLRAAVSILDDIFASEMQRLRGNSLTEKDLSPPGSMKEIHSMLCNDAVYNNKTYYH